MEAPIYLAASPQKSTKAVIIGQHGRHINLGLRVRARRLPKAAGSKESHKNRFAAAEYDLILADKLLQAFNTDWPSFTRQENEADILILEPLRI